MPLIDHITVLHHLHRSMNQDDIDIGHHIWIRIEIAVHNEANQQHSLKVKRYLPLSVARQQQQQ